LFVSEARPAAGKVAKIGDVSYCARRAREPNDTARFHVNTREDEAEETQRLVDIFARIPVHDGGVYYFLDLAVKREKSGKDKLPWRDGCKERWPRI
jgi:hypothetical protein